MGKIKDIQMFRKSIKYSIIAIIIACSNLYALDPDSMLDDGIRAFDLAKWEESREILNRFMETWPQHEKHSKALYYYTLASSKTIDSRTEEFRASLGNQLKNAVASLSNDLPDKDISEAMAAIKIAQKTQKPETWKELESLNPTELRHYLLRHWHPSASEHPFETIEWANSWQKKNPHIDPELLSDILILKLNAMWKILTSPMVRENSEKELTELNCLPLDKTFRQNLHIAFKHGNPNQKKQVAILGYHFDYFNNNRLNTNKQIKSHWLRYLKSRGIAQKETWSPK